MLLSSNIYISVKNIVIFYVEFTTNNYFLSFHYQIFHSEIHKHPACKMNRDEQLRSRSKLEALSEHTF